MFSLTVTALGLVLGSLFWGWILMQFIGEAAAKVMVTSLAVLALCLAPYWLEFANHDQAMWSVGSLLGLVILLLALWGRALESRIRTSRKTNL